MKPILGIIIPLRAPESTSNWNTVSKNCCRTINSILQSTSNNYKIVLVCNEPPDKVQNNERLDILQAQLPIPNDHKGYKRDKGQKIAEGANHLRQQYEVDYLMAFDSDDLIHRRLIEYVTDKPLCSGFCVHKGWVYSGGLFARIQDRFDAMCGSTIIHRDVTHKSEVDPVLMGHCWAKGYYHVIHKPLFDVPFPAVCKIIGYGDNISAYSCFIGPSLTTTIKKITHARPVGRKFKKDFGII